MTLKEARQQCDSKIEGAIKELKQNYIDTLENMGMLNVDVMNTTGKIGRILIGEDCYTHMPKYEFHAYMLKGRLSKKTTGLISDKYDIEEQLRNKFLIVGN